MSLNLNLKEVFKADHKFILVNHYFIFFLLSKKYVSLLFWYELSIKIINYHKDQVKNQLC